MNSPEIRESGQDVPLWHSNLTVGELHMGALLEKYGVTPELADARLRLLGFGDRDLESLPAGWGSHDKRSLVIIAKGTLTRSESHIYRRLKWEDGEWQGDEEDNYLLFTPEELDSKGIEYWREY